MHVFSQSKSVLDAKEQGELEKKHCLVSRTPEKKNTRPVLTNRSKQAIKVSMRGTRDDLRTFFQHVVITCVWRWGITEQIGVVAPPGLLLAQGPCEVIDFFCQKVERKKKIRRTSPPQNWMLSVPARPCGWRLMEITVLQMHWHLDCPRVPWRVIRCGREQTKRSWLAWRVWKVHFLFFFLF